MLKYLGAFIPGRNEINEEFMKRTEESLVLQISVVIVYNIIFTQPLESTATMCGCQTWSMTDRTLSKFLGEEHFEEGV
jgi:hypothetical protein